MTTLTDAMKALDERKTAVWGNDAPAVELGLDQARQMMVGFDLDVSEVSNWSQMAARCAAMAVLDGQTDVGTAIGGMWVDGLLTGLLLAEMRSREEM